MLAHPSAPPRAVVGKVPPLDCSNKCTTLSCESQGEQNGTYEHEWPYSLHLVLTLCAASEQRTCPTTTRNLDSNKTRTQSRVHCEVQLSVENPCHFRLCGPSR